ncbi:hypothetical protein [Streptomyces sp. NBC_00151]|jgi:hypothetical protein|uniref:hypothetical protein n=1 Tax=Streptomyces sp. NBC_00151 TaxID=2975669 RepID=UPI002DD7BEB2|nr:hypothetical protein [Streptomyces sp. NBC_00151]WRZ45573.1 hypothetical protein OG915_43870 [Streptomyces sp. NBC_00151]
MTIRAGGRRNVGAIIAGVSVGAPALATSSASVTLDDSTSLIDLAFFSDSQAHCAHTIFHSRLLLVRALGQ